MRRHWIPYYTVNFSGILERFFDFLANIAVAHAKPRRIVQQEIKFKAFLDFAMAPARIKSLRPFLHAAPRF
jgi:hypothetical protein